MKPTEYMSFVENEVDSLYPGGESIPTEIKKRPDGSDPIAIHSTLWLRSSNPYLGKICWYVTEEGDVPEGVDTIDALAEHPDGRIRMCLARYSSSRSPSSIEFDKEGCLVMPDGRVLSGDTIEHDVKRYLKDLSEIPKSTRTTRSSWKDHRYGGKPGKDHRYGKEDKDDKDMKYG